MSKGYSEDKRVVVTLDAGGTTLVFGAIRGNKNFIKPIKLDAPQKEGDEVEVPVKRWLDVIGAGFELAVSKLEAKKVQPVAISFAFPGPADYPNGIIGPGYLPNFPSFRGGVALGPFLNRKFGIPVYINNDADLYTYGEALAGALPEVNARLEAAGSPKRYKNLLGYTFGTGFGFGFAVNGELHIGDNSCVETYCLRHKKYTDYTIIEDGVSIRAVKRVFGELSGKPGHRFNPYQIYQIAEGERLVGSNEKEQEHNRRAAIGAFETLGEVAGDGMAAAVTMIDGLIVIGGGLTGAKKYIIPGILREMNSKIATLGGDTLDRVQMKVYNLEDEAEFARFAKGATQRFHIYGTDENIKENYVTINPEKSIGITFSKLGASHAVALGAYAFALKKLDTPAGK